MSGLSPVGHGARPLPDPGALGAVPVRLLEGEVLQVLLLVDDDEVDVVGLRRQWSVIDSVVLASGGSHTRTTPGASGSRLSIRPGPWWEKPLWSFRQHVEVSRMLSDDTGARHGSVCACWSHLVCCTAIEADTMANAS